MSPIRQSRLNLHQDCKVEPIDIRSIIGLSVLIKNVLSTSARQSISQIWSELKTHNLHLGEIPISDPNACETKAKTKKSKPLTCLQKLPSNKFELQNKSSDDMQTKKGANKSLAKQKLGKNQTKCKLQTKLSGRILTILQPK